MFKTITQIKVTTDKVALARVWDKAYAEQHAGKTYRAVLNNGYAECATAKFPVGTFEDITTGKVIISDMHDEDCEDLHEISFEGTADDYDFSEQSDELEADEAYDYAKEVAETTNSCIVWEGSYPPAWFC